MDIFEKMYRPSMADDLKEKGLFPYFHPLQSRQDAEVIMEGQRRIMLGSNNYLGLTTHPSIIEAAHRALDEFGSGCSGSRYLNGTLQLHITLEEELARFLRKEDALIFSTGFQTNLGIISAVVGLGDYVICDKENHASIIDGCRLSFGKLLRYQHSNMDDLERLLKKVPASAGCLIVTDGVFSMGGDLAKLPEIVALAKQYGARVMVDDSHGLGVLGDGGRGTASHFGLEEEVDIYMGTFSKSLASIGGYMAAKKAVVDYVRHSSRPLIFSASIPPVSTAVALAALRVLAAEPERVERLKQLSDFARECFVRKGVPIRQTTTPIIPIYTYDAYRTLEVSKRIYEGGVYVNPVLPPATPQGECLLRTSYMASLSETLIEEATDTIARVLAEN